MRHILLIVCAALATACSVVHKDFDVRIERDSVAFEVGRTSYGDVLQALGPPTRLSSLRRGLVFAYEHLTTSEGSFGLESESQFAVFDVSGAGASVDREILLLEFDERGVLQAQSWGERSDDLGSGLGASFLVAADRFVGTESIDEDGGPYEWGLRLLESPFATLNEPQNLGVGDTGIQQRGTQETVGQHALELR